MHNHSLLLTERQKTTLFESFQVWLYGYNPSSVFRGKNMVTLSDISLSLKTIKQNQDCVFCALNIELEGLSDHEYTDYKS